MTLRVAVIGNCHAQYFGAAVGTLPGIEVRTVGVAYPGPIAFEGKLPTCIPAKPIQAWLDEGESGLVLHQVTADSRLDLYNRIIGNRFYPLFKFPYVEFHAVANGVNTAEDVDRDRAYNTGSFRAAGYDLAHLDRLETMVRDDPILFCYNHFGGAGFAVLFDAMIEAGLADYIPRADLEALRERMKLDRGISHMISRAQRDRWPSSLIKTLDDPLAVWKAVRDGEVTEITAHSLWQATASKFNETGRSAYLGILIALYRRNYYSNWLLGLIEVLMKKNRTLLVMIMLGPRIAWEDSRGVLFVEALKLARDIRRSAPAYAALRRLAAKYPESTLPLLLQCCQHIRG